MSPFPIGGNLGERVLMAAMHHNDRKSWLVRSAKRSIVTLLPVLTIGSLALAPSAASASTTSTAAATSGSGVDLGPTLAAVEAEVSAVLNQSVPLIGSLSCVPYDVTSLLSGGRVYPC